MKTENPNYVVPVPEAPRVMREEACTVASVRRVAALLDLEPEQFEAGQDLPRGWHFLLLAADTRRSALREDGFPGLGVPMPDLGLPRLLLGARTVAFLQDIPVGSPVSRRSEVRSIVHKTIASGPMAVVTIGHDLYLPSHPEPALAETQTYLLLPPGRAPETGKASPGNATTLAAAHHKRVVPDDTLLFQYSALGFNSHRIHVDREYAREVEGFPDLVVNGGLSTLLLTEFLRQDLGITPAALSVRHLAPLFSNRPVTLTADHSERGWVLKAFDDQHRLAVSMEVEIQ